MLPGPATLPRSIGSSEQFHLGPVSSLGPAHLIAKDKAITVGEPFVGRGCDRVRCSSGRRRCSAAAANVIEGSAKPVALPAPEAQSPEATSEPTQKHKSNRLMREVDTAVGLRERKPRPKVRTPAST